MTIWVSQIRQKREKTAKTAKTANTISCGRGFAVLYSRIAGIPPSTPYKSLETGKRLVKKDVKVSTKDPRTVKFIVLLFASIKGQVQLKWLVKELVNIYCVKFYVADLMFWIILFEFGYKMGRLWKIYPQKQIRALISICWLRI